MPQYASNYPDSLSYPIASDPVNVHGDFKVLVDALNNILPPLGMTSVSSKVKNNSGTFLIAGTPVFISGSVSGLPTVEKYNPSSPSHNPDVPILGIVQTAIPNNAEGVVVVSGVLQINLTGIAQTVGAKIYVDNNGNLIQGRPSTGPARYVAVAAVLGQQGLLIVQAKGNGTWGALKDGLS
jgi:hypothetical protein